MAKAMIDFEREREAQRFWEQQAAEELRGVLDRGAEAQLAELDGATDCLPGEIDADALDAAWEQADREWGNIRLAPTFQEAEARMVEALQAAARWVPPAPKGWDAV